mmetsp:Transcript_15922/g.39121  ORF Transcript_15922/g.39121 Transcript_15922/m.39121 type:complete len:230 (-) Transcript_15922:722-1411(-)
MASVYAVKKTALITAAAAAATNAGTMARYTSSGRKACSMNTTAVTVTPIVNTDPAASAPQLTPRHCPTMSALRRLSWCAPKAALRNETPCRAIWHTAPGRQASNHDVDDGDVASSKQRNRRRSRAGYSTGMSTASNSRLPRWYRNTRFRLHHSVTSTNLGPRGSLAQYHAQTCTLTKHRTTRTMISVAQAAIARCNRHAPRYTARHPASGSPRSRSLAKAEAYIATIPV